MLLADYAAFLPSLGWLAALMFAALLPSLPAGPWRSHAGWLVTFCAACLLAHAQELAGTTAAGDWPAFGLVASGMLLWEFARRSWNERGRRPIPAATHLLILECLALMAVMQAAIGGAARPPWFVAVEQAFNAVPLVLGSASLLLLWRGSTAASPARQNIVRVAMVSIALFGLRAGGPAVATLGACAPWAFALALATLCFQEPAIRTRAALICAGGLVAIAAIGPLLVTLFLGELQLRQRDDLLGRAGHAAAALQGRIASRLADPVVNPETSRWVQQHLERIALNDPLLRSARIWKLREGRIAELVLPPQAAGYFVDQRSATNEQQNRARESRVFVDANPAGEPALLAVVHVPLTPAIFESPTAWLTLAYPEAYWEVQRQHARRMGSAIIAVFAGFCAMGFVLASRQALENAQRLAAERARSADQAKTEFLAFLSHEMRTPLQTILGRTELLRAAAMADDARRRHADAIETQGRLLLRLVNDLLDLGTLEAGKFQLRPQPFSLRQALAAVEDTIRDAAAAKRLEFTLEIAADVPDGIVGDEARLRQILGNVVGNAVKYTAQGRVTLAVVAEPGESGTARLLFRITDTGPGLPPDKLPQLFTLFTRLNPGDTFTREGTGVGLALVRRLCELMGGGITAANRRAGGAEFVVRLTFPVNAADASGDDAREATPTGGLRVLVAEDNAAAREFLLEALEALGHRGVGVADGKTALQAATTQRFDAVLLDVNLPGRDGVDIARTLASQPRRPRLIGCSAEVFAHTRTTALAAGMDAFLEKPVTLGLLASALQPSAPLAMAAEHANLFERLRRPDLVARTQADLARELPAVVAEVQAAELRGDIHTLAQRVHALHSSALMADDAALAELCRQLELAAAAGRSPEISRILRELARHAGAAVP